MYRAKFGKKMVGSDERTLRMRGGKTRMCIDVGKSTVC